MISSEEKLARIMYNLKRMKVNFIHTSYEGSMYGPLQDKLQHWDDVIRFVDPGFPKNRSIAAKDLELGIASTHSTREEAVLHYSEIKKKVVEEFPQYAVYLDEPSVDESMSTYFNHIDVSLSASKFLEKCEVDN